MAHTISLSEDKKYILLRVIGEQTRKLSMQQNIESHTLGRQLGINRYLVDLREARNTEPVLDKYSFAYEDMQNAPEIDKLARVAFVVSPDDHSHDFVVTVAQNAGFNVNKFTDFDQAVQHLTKE